MAEFIIQHKDGAGNKLYPVTLLSAVIDSDGRNLDDRLKQSEDNVLKAVKAVEDTLVEVEYVKKSLSILEKSVDLVEDSIQSVTVLVDAIDARVVKVEESNLIAVQKVESFDSRMTKIESDTVTALAKVEEFTDLVTDLEEKVEILNADAETEGSVDYKIYNALGWKALS